MRARQARAARDCPRHGIARANTLPVVSASPPHPYADHPVTSGRERTRSLRPNRPYRKRLRGRRQQAENRNGACQPFRSMSDLIAGYSLASRIAIPARCGHRLASYAGNSGLAAAAARSLKKAAMSRTLICFVHGPRVIASSKYSEPGGRSHGAPSMAAAVLLRPAGASQGVTASR